MNVKDKKEYNKDIVECKLTEFLFDTNFQDPYNCLYFWASNEILDVDSCLDCLEIVFKYDNLAKDKFKKVRDLNDYLDTVINPSLFNKLFIPKNYTLIQDTIFEIKKLRSELDDVIKLTKLLYKIINNIIIPSFKADKIKSYQQLLYNISELEINFYEKELIIVESLNEHCDALNKL